MRYAQAIRKESAAMNKKLWIAGAVGLVWAFGVSSYINGQNKDQIDRSMAEYTEQRAKQDRERDERKAKIQAQQDARDKDRATQYSVEQAIRSASKDPDSVQFQNQSGGCGQVNAKNSFGGYTGFKRYVFTGVSIVVEDQGDGNGNVVSSADISDLWRRYCT